MEEKRVLLSRGYMIPGYGFRLEKVSYFYIADHIRHLIETHYLDKLKGWDLHLDIVFTDDRTNPMEKGIVLGPSRDTYHKIMSYSLHLPSSKIICGPYPFREFCRYFFEILTDLLSAKFGIKKDEVKAIEETVAESFSPINGKILCNPVY